MFDLEQYKDFIKNQVVSNKVTYLGKNIKEVLIEALLQFNVAPSLYIYDIPMKVVSQKYKQLFKTDEKPNSIYLNDWFLFKFGYKHCPQCKEIRAISEYQVDEQRWNRLRCNCRICSNNLRSEHTKQNLDKSAAKSAKRRAKKLQATPIWLTAEQLKEIQTFYTETKKLEQETGVKYHVDHIIPLLGENVCGLHVPWNLQILTAEENQRKNNRF
jgi:hypothetical protein